MMNLLTENEPIDGDFLITSGREFHKTGPKQLIDSCFIFKRAGWHGTGMVITWYKYGK